MEYAELSLNKSAFLERFDECSTIFDISRRLPKQVFRRDLHNYYAIEHGYVLRPEFGKFLHQIADKYHDASVNYMSLEPDPVEYYFNRCGFYGLASFNPANLEKNYLSVMSRGGAADSFKARGGDVAAIWGSSLNWGIFCDRNSWDLCIIGTAQKLDKALFETIHPLDSPALNRFVSNGYRHKPNVPMEFLKEFPGNYNGLGAVQH